MNMKYLNIYYICYKTKKFVNVYLNYYEKLY